MSMRKMFFKRKYFEYILSGEKILEGRIGYDNISKIEIGDFVLLNGVYKAKITKIKRYSTFIEAVNESNYKLLIPDSKSIEDTLRIYERLFPIWKQKKFGVIIFTIQYPA